MFTFKNISIKEIQMIQINHRINKNGKVFLSFILGLTRPKVVKKTRVTPDN
jgi:hypothetical protein